MKRRWFWLALLAALAIAACDFGPTGATDEAPVDPAFLATQADCEEAGFTWQEDSSAENCVEPCVVAMDCVDDERPFCRNIGLFAGGDFDCNISALVCKADDQDQCI